MKDYQKMSIFDLGASSFLIFIHLNSCISFSFANLHKQILTVLNFIDQKSIGTRYFKFFGAYIRRNIISLAHRCFLINFFGFKIGATYNK